MKASAEDAVDLLRNNGRSRSFAVRNDPAQSSNVVVSIDASVIHDPPNHGGQAIQKSFNQTTKITAVMLGRGSPKRNKVMRLDPPMRDC
jgi:hypothetical protein